MKKGDTDVKESRVVWWYLAVVLFFSYLWQFVIYLNGGLDSALFPLLMLFPMLVAVAFRLARGEGFRDVGWGLRRWWYLIPALMVPIIVVIAVGWLLTILDWAVLSDEHFLFKEGMVEIQRIPFVLGTHPQTISFFLLNFVLSLFVQSLLGSVVTIGEEFGWRGYAQEKLIRAFGLNRGLVILGVIWGYWHLPIGLMGWNFPNLPILGALVLTPISTVFLGVFLGWLYLRSGSIWVPTFAHAALNLCAMLLLGEMVMQRSDLYLQLMFIAVLGVVAGFCLISLNAKNPVSPLNNDGNEGAR